MQGTVQGTGLGTRLIDAMAKSLRTTIDYAPSPSAGVRATLSAAIA